MGVVAEADLFAGTWGIVQFRRAEIEAGSHGAFGRAYKQEKDKNFLSITRSAEIMDCSPSTARVWLERTDARYLLDGAARKFYAKDVVDTKQYRDSTKKPALAQTGQKS